MAGSGSDSLPRKRFHDRRKVLMCFTSLMQVPPIRPRPTPVPSFRFHRALGQRVPRANRPQRQSLTTGCWLGGKGSDCGQRHSNPSTASLSSSLRRSPRVLPTQTSARHLTCPNGRPLHDTLGWTDNAARQLEIGDHCRLAFSGTREWTALLILFRKALSSQHPRKGESDKKVRRSRCRTRGKKR
jgi:hypothetical protein